MEVFYRFAPFIQEYIYRQGWERLRGVQLEAARVLFETDDNLLLTSSTASGKTEAAFFPIITMMYEDPPQSFGTLYIAPLKSLINDQFERLTDVLELSGIPVFHWHGDVAQSHKTKALGEPRGILQITPESLEAMLINRSNDIPRIFGDLRFVVIDEVHVLMGSDRGSQIICQLSRIARLIGYHPRRVGLSATIGDVRLAADWLGAGTGRATQAPVLPDSKIVWRLGMEHFYIDNPNADQSDQEQDLGLPQEEAGAQPSGQPEATPPEGRQLECDPRERDGTEEPGSTRAMLDPGYEYIYECTRGKKCLVFANSREETEYVCATLREIAELRGEPDRFLIHHGFLSASIREEAEAKLKAEEEKVVTCATVTLELGIDIGKLERIVQLDGPFTVSNFLQRLGRSGRRGDPPEMMMVFREEEPLPNTPLPQMIPWGLLRAIAIVQLYIEERFIEPPSLKKMPMSLLFHQTLSTVAASGELTPKRLAERVLTLPPFLDVSREDYKKLLLSMLEHDYLEMTDEKGLIVGLKGERLINNYKFYAVFKDTDDWTVRCGSEEIGVISFPPPVGDRFALAGRVWEVEELDIPRKLIFVTRVKGKMEISWPGDYGEIHTKILERMKRVLEEDTDYPYLKPNARHRLWEARNLARNTGMLEKSLVHLGGFTWSLFPWLGTRSFRTLRKFIVRNSGPLGLSNLEYDGCYYMTFRMERGTAADAVKLWHGVIKEHGIDKYSLVQNTEIPLFDKFDDKIPYSLLRKAYAEDRLRTDELVVRLEQIMLEFE
ncbi:MAG TPA: DEAD/DEAH box helicase [Bacillota bacterium]|nr:DEAD/DEAH box helicase [Bacillota bacterium]